MLMTGFHWISLFEGVTTLMLFLIAMPLKYIFGYEALIRPFGMLHGIAFLGYIVVMAMAFSANSIHPIGWLRSFIASLFPFGTFLNDPWLKEQTKK